MIMENRLNSNQCGEAEAKVIRGILEHFEITAEDMFSDSNKQPGSRARQTYVFVMVSKYGWKYENCRQVIGCSHSYVSQIMKRYYAKMSTEIGRKKFSYIQNL